MVAGSGPAAGYNFNTFQEIKSHSSILYNNRCAILFYLLDMESINLNTYHQPEVLLKVRALLKQIYKNIRTLIRNNPVCRATLNLDTKDSGIYITDVMMGMIDRMIEYCESHFYTLKNVYIIVDELNNFEMVLKDVLQYYHYFIRPDFRQKPDIEIATEKYKEITDERTIEELRQLVGKRNKIDFEGLGSSRVELLNQINYKDDDNDDSDDDEEEEFDNEPDNKLSTKDLDEEEPDNELYEPYNELE